MYVSTGDITSGMVEMYQSRIDELNRDNIVKDFSTPNGHIRVLIATIAYGMGINCQGVKSIVHYGPSRNVEAYLQESGIELVEILLICAKLSYCIQMLC